MRAINNKSHTAWPRSARYCSHHPAIRSDTQLKSSISHLSRGYFAKKTSHLHVEGTTLFYAFLECLQDSCSWKLSKKKQESSLLKLRISMSIERRWEPENGENAGGRRWQSENEGGQVSPALLKTRTICRPVVQSIKKYLWVSILHKSNRKWFSEIYDGRHCGL